MQIGNGLGLLVSLLVLTAAGCTRTQPMSNAPPQEPPAVERNSHSPQPVDPTPRAAEPAVEPKTARQTAESGPFAYLLYLPPNYGEGARRCPLLLFLHGAGERGDNLDLVKKHGPPKLIEAEREFPFIIVSPQCPRNEWWDTQKLSDLLDQVCQKYAVDPDRVYLTGLSMGGFGTWALACEQPDRFAAIAPICGGGDPGKATSIRHLPAWVFHGGKDGVVPPERSREMVDALRAAGGDPRLTIYPDRGHNSWTPAYQGEALYDWLLTHRRPAKP